MVSSRIYICTIVLRRPGTHLEPRLNGLAAAVATPKLQNAIALVAASCDRSGLHTRSGWNYSGCSFSPLSSDVFPTASPFPLFKRGINRATPRGESVGARRAFFHGRSRVNRAGRIAGTNCRVGCCAGGEVTEKRAKRVAREIRSTVQLHVKRFAAQRAKLRSDNVATRYPLPFPPLWK